MKFAYPTARRDSFSEIIHGKNIADPYRWLEDPDSPETQNFVQEQNKLVQGFLSHSTIRSKIKESLTRSYDYPKYGCPSQHGNAFYYFHNSGLQQQSVLYKQDSLDGEPRIFFDPNTLSEDGTVSLSTCSFSECGNYFAYALSNSGSDWVKIHVRKTNDDETADIDEPIEWAKFTSIEWTHDGNGFFYNRYPKPTVDTTKAGTETDSNANSAIYYHRLGTSQKDDVKIFDDPENPTNLFGFEVSTDGNYLVVTVSESCDPKNKLLFCKIGDLSSRPLFTEIVGNFENQYSFITNDGPVFYLKTTLDAPMKRVVKFNVEKPEMGFEEVVAQSNDVISFLAISNHNKLVIARLQDVKHVVTVYDLYTGNLLYELPLPMGSIIVGMSTERKYDYVFYNFSSMISPSTTYRFDFPSKSHTLFRETKVQGIRTDELVTKQVFYNSKDGTKIPMFLLHKKSMKLDSNNPTVLYGYGGFNISITPTFSPNFATFVQHFNGIFAIANIRGGGEYGQEKWYWEGRLEKKQNVFDDFQYAAKYLVSEKYTCPQRLAINGGSNGGLLVGACVNQAPELYAAAVAEVGVLDMYRFHKFTIGHAWKSDYGNPDVKEDFEILEKYSPLHNVKEQEYPAILVLTGDHDDRVVPLHSHKFLATLQHVAKNNKNPIMGRIETKAGHGAGKSTSQRIEEAADKFTFLSLVLGAEWNE